MLCSATTRRRLLHQRLQPDCYGIVQRLWLRRFLKVLQHGSAPATTNMQMSGSTAASSELRMFLGRVARSCWTPPRHLLALLRARRLII